MPQSMFLLGSLSLFSPHSFLFLHALRSSQNCRERLSQSLILALSDTGAQGSGPPSSRHLLPEWQLVPPHSHGAHMQDTVRCPFMFVLVSPPPPFAISLLLGVPCSFQLCTRPCESCLLGATFSLLFIKACWNFF